MAASNEQRIANAVRAKRRDPLVPLPTVPIVAPNGSVRWATYSRQGGGHGALIRVEGGRARVAQSYLDDGWSLLEDLYRAEGFAAGWEAYANWKAAYEGGQKVAAFPDANLPREVILRRGGKSASQKKLEVPVLKRENGPTTAELKAAASKKKASGGRKA